MKLDGYIARQLAVAALVVVVSLTCVIWLSQSLRFVDMIVNRGLPLGTFLHLTALLLPTWLSIVLPIAVFAAVLFVYGRMTGDREIVVLEAAGLGPLRLARPALLAGVAVSLLCYAMTLWLVPLSYRAFKELQFRIRHDNTGVLLREGVFNALPGGVTVYIRERGESGELAGVIVHDERDPEETVTMLAERGALSFAGNGPSVFMRQGSRQTRDAGTGRIGLLYFDSYAVDLGGGKAAEPRIWRDRNELHIRDLLAPKEHQTLRRDFDAYIAEGHHRLTAPLLAVALPAVGLAVLLGGPLTRRQQTWRVLVAVALAAGLEALGLGGKLLAARQPWWIPFMYVSILGPAGLALAALARRRLRRPGPRMAALAARAGI